MGIISAIGQSLLAAFGMAWDVLWSLVLGFLISGMIQAYVSRAKMSQALGKAGLKEVALAVGFGAASSSCSYAAIAAAKSMFKRGAHLIPALAFMFASTNLVIELGLVLWQLMGWQFAVAEWFGGIVLVAIMVALVKLTYPKGIVEEGRAHQEDPRVNAMDHGDELAPGHTLWEKLRSREGWVYVAHYVAMDWAMLWRDLIGGFIIAGFLAVLIPNAFWNGLFIQHAAGPVRLIENAVVGPIVAVISFVCSVGNVPLAAILFSGGITFGGAIAFLYADLIVLPILDIYRKYYGWKLAAYITAILFVTMILAGIIVDLVFTGLDRLFPRVHFIPAPNHHLIQMVEHITLNYTTILNIIALLVVAALVIINRRHPMMMHTMHGDDHAAMSMGHDGEHTTMSVDHADHATMAEMAEAHHTTMQPAHRQASPPSAPHRHHRMAGDMRGWIMKHFWTLTLVAAVLATIALLAVVVPGTPGANTTASAPPNTVYVTETDFAISATQTSFKPGVRYHFVVTNNSPDAHEFMVGPQMPVGMSMDQMDKMMLGVIDTLNPHQTKTLDLTFPANTATMNGMNTNQLEFSCHLPGHYEAGMLLPITVTSSM